MTRSHLLSRLGLRLAAAFASVAVSAVAVLAALTLVSARDEVSTLVRKVHVQDARATAVAAAHAYEAAGGWAGAELSSAAAIAARGQADLAVVDDGGRVVAVPATEASEMMASMHGVTVLDVARAKPVTAPVVVGGRTVGSVALRFPASHLPTPERQIRAALSRNVILGAGLAVLSAVAVAMFVARRVSRPIEALTAAVAQIEGGRRDVRVDLENAPGEIGTLAAAFDRMAEALAREDDLRRQLVADVAHELRTPLSILRGTTEGLVDGVVTADPVTLGTLHEEVLRLTRLVADLETLASADAAGLHLDAGPTDLAAAAAAVVELARPTADADDLALTADLAPAPLVGDDHRLRQIVTTLVANALAYTPPGGSVSVRTGLVDGDAVLQVRDTGPGIDDADLPHIFDRFYRGRRTAAHPGSGIGLAVARELVKAHGGRISARNNATAGATFTVRIPSNPEPAHGRATTLLPPDSLKELP